LKTKRALKGLILTFLILLSLPCSAFALDFDAESLYNAIFVINSGLSLGSGFAIGENCILTNAHVIDSVEQITVDTYDGKSYRARLLAKNNDLDLAVLYVDDTSFQFLSVGSADDLKIGDDVFAIGAPDSLDYTLTKGILSSKSRNIGNYSYIQANISLNHGNSGGPLLNAMGEVIGINTMTMQGVEGIGFAIPVSAALDYIKSNGVKLDSSGNVDGIVTGNNKSETENNVGDTDASDKFEAPTNKGIIDTFKFSSLTLILVLALVLILILAGIIIFFALRKNKTQNMASDPRERTDFEIEIEE